ncbi:CDK-activating kinase assembly factor isoform X2 [Tachypleus tridentatus]
MDEAACPRCKTTKYRNPSLKLLVNVCGHALCENCVELLFLKGSGTCAECGIPLRRNDFRIQIFEDPYVEKEVDIRRKILKDFNKREEEFSSLREYNDYLEEIETIIFNLVNNVDFEATKRKIELYKKENRTQISKNRGKISRDEEELEILLEQEKQQTHFRKQQFLEEEKEIKKSRLKQKEALIDDLMFSDLPAGQILASHVSNVKETEISRRGPTKPTVVQFSTGITLGQKETFIPIPKEPDGELYVYRELVVPLCGPNPPIYDMLEANGYTKHVRTSSETEKAGGFTSKLACYRALQEGVCGLYFIPKQ